MKQLLKALHSAFSECEAAEKDMQVGKGSYGYKGVSEKEVLGKIKPVFKAHGLLAVPSKTDTITSKNYSEVDGKVKLSVFTEVTMTVTVYHAYSGESLDMVGYGHGVDSADKSAGKAFTYAYKNAMLKAMMMVSGEDTDNHHSNDAQTGGKPDFELSHLALTGKYAKEGRLRADMKQWLSDNFSVSSLKKHGQEIDKVLTDNCKQ